MIRTDRTWCGFKFKLGQKRKLTSIAQKLTNQDWKAERIKDRHHRVSGFFFTKQTMQLILAYHSHRKISRFGKKSHCIGYIVFIVMQVMLKPYFTYRIDKKKMAAVPLFLKK